MTRRVCKPRVTVIIRTKNSASILSQTLEALFSQELCGFELLIVDSGSVDDTLEVVSRYPARVLHVAPDDYFPGRVLNRAAEAARGDFLAFVNSDTVPLVTTALCDLLRPFRDPEVVASFGRQVPRPEAEAWVRRDYAVAFPVASEAPSWMTLSLPFAAMRRSAWMTRPFYTDAWGSEDTEWGTWARQSGRRVVYVPTAIAMHSHNYTLSQLYGRRYIEGEADAFIQRNGWSAGDSLRAWASSCGSDLCWHLRAHRPVGLLKSPFLRAVFHWGYFRGRRWGIDRIRHGDPDVGRGQRIVLRRHEAAR